MNLIFIFNSNLSTQEIQEKLLFLENLNYNYNVIIKLVSNNNLDFFSYKTSFNNTAYLQYEKLKNNPFIFNFDIYNQNQILKFEDNQNLFFDIYVDNNNKNLQFSNIFKNVRLDLNIINDATPLNLNKLIFKNIDYYYSNPNTKYFELQNSNINLLDYLKEYSKTIIFKYNKQQQNWELLIYSINRFQNTGYYLNDNQINPEKQMSKIRKMILLNTNKNDLCINCHKITNCIERDLFFYFNKTNICNLFNH